MFRLALSAPQGYNTYMKSIENYDSSYSPNEQNESEYIEFTCGACEDEGYIEFCCYCDCAAGEQRRDETYREEIATGF